MASPSELGNSTSSQLDATTATLIVPLGSVEQHGPHLPLDTDTRIAVAVADAVAQRLGPGRAVVAPPVNYGASGEHEGFPGTVSLGTAALTTLLVEFGRSAARWATRVLLVNGHGGNLDAVVAAVRRLRAEHRDAAWTPCLQRTADAHAGHTETSVLLHLCPAAVRTELAVAGNTAPLDQLLPRMRLAGVAAVSAVGILGDPRTADAAAGARIFGDAVDRCAAAAHRWQPDGDGRLR